VLLDQSEGLLRTDASHAFVEVGADQEAHVDQLLARNAQVRERGLEEISSGRTSTKTSFRGSFRRPLIARFFTRRGEPNRRASKSCDAAHTRSRFGPSRSPEPRLPRCLNDRDPEEI